MPSPSQQNRPGKLIPAQPLGPDDLLLVRFSGSEAVNELFEFNVETMSPLETISLDEAVGKHFTVELIDIYGASRYFDGLLTDIRALGIFEGGKGYALTLRPEIWVLDKRRNQRIFHNQTAQDIVTKVLGDYGFQADWDVGSLPTLEYTVQYGESDLTFIRRIMERFGLNFYFAHANGSHKLKINDGTFKDKAANLSRPISPVAGQHMKDEEHFQDWVHDRRITTGKVRLTDYNFKTPRTSLEAQQAGDAGYTYNAVESFDYPGGYPDGAGANDTSGLRLKQERGADNHHRAKGDVMSLEAGMVVHVHGLDDALVDDKDFVALSCRHSYVSVAYATGSGLGTAGEDSYVGHYEFSPKDQPIHPPMITAKAKIRGPQVALVVGQGEIDCDEFGRITVRFPWDLENSVSMRCRVLQPWAGAGWGNVFIPRVGMEVLVEFLDGDPDFPVVVGSLYNGVNSTPYPLPGSKNISGVKSNSTPGGGGYNELVLDDTAGKELIRMHAQYDLDSTVEHDERRLVKNNRDTTIKVNDTRTVEGTDTHTITKKQTTTVKDAQETKVTMDRTIKVDANQTVTVQQAYDITAHQQFTVTVGACKLVMDGTKIELSVGPISKVTIDKDKIEVSSSEVKASALTNLETSSLLTAKHTAAMALDVTALMVKINS